ncbi:MAG TPA: prephenate dehydratase [Candidatus Limnocylindria bacterium]|jgi:prephenate dehydratase|nr:prephenate dehydratase [Candidatus Limnocylindria bacterium]
MADGGVQLTAVAYQGLAGAFSEAAAAALFPGAGLAPRRTFAEVFAALEAQEVDAAVVPVENTHAGSVADVYDLLRQHAGAKIVAELILRVSHCLLGVRGARLDEVRVARSHPQALAQVEEFLRQHRIAPEVAFDTAGAAAEVATAGDPAIAAVASRRAGERYGLDVLADAIETSGENFTRFFALARDDDLGVAELVPAALRAGPTKTSLVYKTANLPGALVRSLQPFATAWIQLTKIESRPSRAAPWDYVFYLDFEGDPTAWPTKEALALMRTCCEWTQILGTYPAATKVLEPD